MLVPRPRSKLLCTHSTWKIQPLSEDGEIGSASWALQPWL